MPGMAHAGRMEHDPELAAILDAAEAAGLVETYTDAQGRQVMRLTPMGEGVARRLEATEGAAGDPPLASPSENSGEDPGEDPA